LFVEALTLAALGGVVGLLLATGILSVVIWLAPPEVPRLQDVTLSGPALLFAAALALVTSVSFCVLSAGRTLALRPLGSLGLSFADAPLVAAAPRRRLRVLAAVEIAITLVLLVGAGLLIRSLVSRVLIDQGFDGTGALAMQISLPPARYRSPAERQAFHQQLLERLPQISGARAAGLAVSMPNRQATARFDFGPEERPADLEPGAMNVAEVRSVSEGFFEAMGVPLIAGRTFRASDNDGAEPAIVISQSLARQHFPNSDAVGRILYSRTGNRRVIGVVGDVRPDAPDARSSPAAAYLTFRQDSGVFEWFAGMTIVLRGPDPRSLAAPMRTLVLSMDPGVPPFNVRTLDDDVSRLVAGPRFSATVLAAFAIVALVLAAIGVYGVMAYTASQRTREIGVRIALGATDRQVLRMVLRDGLVIVAGGLVAGLAVAIWSAQGLTGLLYEVRPADPLTLAATAALLALVGLIAIYLPARRATRINAVEALRTE
jgi:putative ABC transport system permease protein